MSELLVEVVCSLYRAYQTAADFRCSSTDNFSPISRSIFTRMVQYNTRTPDLVDMSGVMVVECSVSVRWVHNLWFLLGNLSVELTFVCQSTMTHLSFCDCHHTKLFFCRWQQQKMNQVFMVASHFLSRWDSYVVLLVQDIPVAPHRES